VPLTPDDTARLRDLARGIDPVFAAAALDGMINSTSLVLVLQIGKARLLLPGDAEWGTWKVILASSKARTLLAGTTFLKVGHHGSHNATPKTLVEQVLPEKLLAMISTQQGPGKYRNDIPLTDLLTAFSDHEIDYARSDREGKLSKAFEADDAGWIDLHLAW